MRLKLCCDHGPVVSKWWPTEDVDGLIQFVKSLAAEHGAERIVFAYEASGRGFGLYDRLRAAGIECHVLAPTHLPRTPHSRRNKTDDKDAQTILDEVRSHLLAARKLPTVWVPDPQTRSDRELVRGRLELAEAQTRMKNQIRSLLKRNHCKVPDWFTKSGNWSQKSIDWLRVLAGMTETPDPGSPCLLPENIQPVLASYITLYEEMRRQLKLLDAKVEKLSQSDRYRQSVRKLKLIKGVGALTIMTFLTELGDLTRFANRRQLAAYLGLAPSAFESGNCDDRKGHITHQGPSRVRHVLCQASWACLRYSETWRAKYDRIRRGSSKRSTIAIVGIMRQLAITMWHAARSPEWDALLAEANQTRAKTKQKASVRARQKGSPPSTIAITST
jgi:transposase